MNTFIKLLDNLYANPILVWLLGTVVAFVCLIVAIGIKWACGLLAAWLLVTMIAYTAERNNQ